jgi:uncharacterized BrkB/YihY/UPF0761 family membrane protein
MAGQPNRRRPGRRLFESRADVAHFLRPLVRRFLNDLCLERAAALSYTSVVSLVPAAAVSLAFLSALPQSDALRSGLGVLGVVIILVGILGAFQH